MRFKFMILLMMLILALAGCNSRPEKIEIGVMAPLTGNAAELGEHIQTGLQLANEDLDERYHLIFEDDMCVNTKAALSAAQKFADLDNVDLVIGPLCAPPYQAVSGVFNQNEIGFMHTSGVTPSFIETSGEFGIPGLSTTIYEEDKFLADFIFGKGIRKMGVFVWNQEWAIEHRKGFVDRFTELGGGIVFDEKFEISDADFRTSILKLEKSGADGVFIVALNFQNANIVRQIKEMNVDVEIFGQFEIEDPAFLEPTGKAAEGVMYVYPKIEENSDVKEFREEYKERFGHEPNYYAYIGFDSLMLYHWAIEECGDADAECVISKIRTAKDFPGVSGLMTFNKDRTLSRQFEMKIVRNGKFEKI
ncbi:MAG: penicillin-binding protein activator [Nanoarchaeota archaeon]|nr:penicillin-binding protein activator [Nanoarchaeota archaeon]